MITVHPDWIKFASEWHGGQRTALYSVASTGKLYLSRASDLLAELRELIKEIPQVHDQFRPAKNFTMWAIGVNDVLSQRMRIMINESKLIAALSRPEKCTCLVINPTESTFTLEGDESECFYKATTDIELVD